jgi:hypothetical protein
MGSVRIASRRISASTPIICAVAMLIYECTLCMPLSKINGILHNNSEDYFTQYTPAVLHKA